MGTDQCPERRMPKGWKDQWNQQETTLQGIFLINRHNSLSSFILRKSQNLQPSKLLIPAPLKIYLYGTFFLRDFGCFDEMVNYVL